MTNKKNAEGRYYYALEAPKKAVRPRQERQWVYCDRQSLRPLITVHRTDDGEGSRKFWQVDHGGKGREACPIYKYQEVRAFVASGDLPIFIVEGESCADALWDLALPATCNIGGAGKWKDSDTLDLEGAQCVVLCPDRDRPGIAHCENIAESFARLLPLTEIKWLYAFPDSHYWENLPSSGGLDLADWISDYALSSHAILAEVGERRKFAKEAEGMPGDKLAMAQKQIAEIAHLDGIAREIAIAQVKQLFDLSEKAVNTALTAFEEKTSYQEFDKFLKDLSELESEILPQNFLPESLIKVLEEKGLQMGVRQEVLLTALLAVSSILQHPRTRLRIREDYLISPGVYGAIVGDSGSKKSPALNLVTSPLKRLNAQAREEHEEDLSAYRQELRKWEADKSSDKGDEPIKPQRRLYSTSSATGEALAEQLSKVPDQGILLLTDELAALFKEQNQYRRGADKEALLSAYDGGGFTFLRVSGIERECESPLIGVLGTIQPGVFEEIAGGADPSGMWSRFFFCLLPFQGASLSLEDFNRPEVAGPLITKLYSRIEERSKRERVFTPTREAYGFFLEVIRHFESKQRKETNPGLKNVWGKSEGKVCKLAIALHTIWHADAELDIPAEIGKPVFEAAFALVGFFNNQYRALAMQGEDSDDAAIASVLRIAARRETWVSARDVKRSNNRLRLTSMQVQRLFLELESQGYGQTKRTDRSGVVFKAL